jgi:heme-degrading monooxygenase HmoA
MYLILWEFEVAAERRDEFCAIYAAGGDWAQLFAQAPGYLGTDLLASCEDPARFLTVDRWTSAEHFADFQRNFHDTYAALDARCQGLTLSESRLGAFISSQD